MKNNYFTPRMLLISLCLAACIGIHEASGQLLPIEWDNDSGDLLWQTHANWREFPGGADPHISDILDFRETFFSGVGPTVYLEGQAWPQNLFLQTNIGGLDLRAGPIDPENSRLVIGGDACEQGCGIHAETSFHVIEPTVFVESSTGMGANAVRIAAGPESSIQFSGALELNTPELRMDASGDIYLTKNLIDLSSGTYIVKEGAGTLWLGADNSGQRTGNWELQNGTTHVLVSHGFGDGFVLLTGGNVSFEEVTVDNVFQLNPSPTGTPMAAFSVDDGKSANINGDLTGSSGFVKRGGGTLALNGVSNTHTGDTNVEDGVLNVSGTLSGSVNVLSDGALTGTPSIFGSLSNSGIVAPGNSPGKISIGGDFNLDRRSQVEIEVGGLEPETQHDFIDVTGTTTLGGVFEFPLINGFTPTVGDSIRFLKSGTIVGDNDSFAPIVPNLQPGISARVIVNSNSLDLEFVATQFNQFVDPSASAIWDSASAWSGESNPTSRDIATISNVTNASPVQTLTVTENAVAHAVIVADGSREITLRVDNQTLTALSPTGFIVGQNATLWLSRNKTGPTTSRLVTPAQIAIQKGGRLIGHGEIVGPSGIESGARPLELIVGASQTPGTLSPGDSDVRTGNIHIKGNLTLESKAVTEIDIDGDSAGEFDQVTLEGEMSLGGRLTVDARTINAPDIDQGVYTPIRIPIVIAETWDGTKFDDVSSLVGLGATVRVIYPDGEPGLAALGPTISDVEIEVGVVGDMIPDGFLDQDDVTAFATALRNPDDYLYSAVGLGDMNADGRFDFDDTQRFKDFVNTHFPPSAVSTFNALFIPEPSGFSQAVHALFIIVIPGLVARRRRTVCCR